MLYRVALPLSVCLLRVWPLPPFSGAALPLYVEFSPLGFPPVLHRCSFVFRLAILRTYRFFQSSITSLLPSILLSTSHLPAAREWPSREKKADSARSLSYFRCFETCSCFRLCSSRICYPYRHKESSFPTSPPPWLIFFTPR